MARKRKHTIQADQLTMAVKERRHQLTEYPKQNVSPYILIPLLQTSFLSMRLLYQIRNHNKDIKSIEETLYGCLSYHWYYQPALLYLPYLANMARIIVVPRHKRPNPLLGLIGNGCLTVNYIISAIEVAIRHTKLRMKIINIFQRI